MTTTIGSAITARVIQLITGPKGVNARLGGQNTGGGLTRPLSAAQVRAQNVAPDVADKSNTTEYPAVNVFCEKVVNSLVEKFRTFSGSAQMAVELRHSHDRLEGLQDGLELYADAIMQVLNENRGDWGDGMFYGGVYQTVFGVVKHGGKNFMQTAKITFEIGVSRS